MQNGLALLRRIRPVLMQGRRDARLRLRQLLAGSYSSKDEEGRVKRLVNVLAKCG